VGRWKKNIQLLNWRFLISLTRSSLASQFVDTAGRIDKFRTKYGKWSKDTKADAGEEAEAEAPKEETKED